MSAENPPAEDASAEAALEAFIDAYVAENDVFLIDHEIQITSFGGSGTTALYRILSEAGLSIPKGPGQWPFKHHRSPPTADEIPGGYRVLYVVGDPRNAIISLFRRNYQVKHYEPMHNRLITPEIEARMSSLETFLEAGIDDFELADHFDQWRNHPPGYPVMFLRYEFIHEMWDEVCRFVGLPEDHPPFETRPRSSDWEALEPGLRDRLDAMYGAFAATIAGLPPVQII